MAPLGCTSFYIGLYREIYLKRSLSKTTELISTKFGRKHLWGMRIKFCENEGAGTFWGPERGYIGGNFGVSANFLSQTTGPNALMFGMKQP